MFKNTNNLLNFRSSPYFVKDYLCSVYWFSAFIKIKQVNPGLTFNSAGT